MELQRYNMRKGQNGRQPSRGGETEGKGQSTERTVGDSQEEEGYKIILMTDT
jgi:hypothetical protein